MFTGAGLKESDLPEETVFISYFSRKAVTVVAAVFLFAERLHGKRRKCEKSCRKRKETPQEELTSSQLRSIIKCRKLSTGASVDLAYATSTAINMVCTYGMDAEQGLATVSKDELFNSEAGERVRSAVNRTLNKEMENAIRLISENTDKIDRLVEALIQKNHLAEQEIDAFTARGYIISFRRV